MTFELIEKLNGYLPGRKLSSLMKALQVSCIESAMFAMQSIDTRFETRLFATTYLMTEATHMIAQ
jgi:hypothetical protein